MNYFLLLVILGVCGGAYYTYTSDQEQIATLQQQVNDLNAELKKGGGGAVASETPTTVSPTVQPASPAPAAPSPSPATVAPAAPVTTVAPTAVLPQPGHANTIDSAANAAVAAANSTSIGTITTLDHKTYTNCKVLKVEKDGVTFSHDDGITKILYPMMSPEVQKQFGYTPAGAVAATEAEIRAREQAARTSNAAPAATP